MSEPLLEVRGVSSGYGDAVILDDVSFALPARGSLAVLGRNGMGKTTLILTLLGHLRLRAGSIALAGADISRAAPHERTAAGLGWVPQGREVFPSLTTDEHLRIAAHPGPWDRERVYALFPRLRERRRNFGNQLSGGEQQMLAIGRALMTNPKLLLLDEPLEGLAPVVVAEVGACLRALIETEGTTVVLVEQHAKFALELTREAIVLERGRIVHAGLSARLSEDLTLLDSMIGMRRLHEAGHDPASHA